MDFDIKKAREALKVSNNNFDEAIKILALDNFSPSKKVKQSFKK